MAHAAVTFNMFGYGNDGNARGVAALDADDDGNIDLFFGSTMNPGIRGWKNDGAATPSFPQAFQVSSQHSMQRLRSGDMDNDGDEDLVGCDADATNVPLYVVENTRNFSSARVHAFGANRATDLLLADLNRDGWLDVVESEQWNTVIRFYRNLKTSPPNFAGPVNIGGIASNIGLASADLNGDGFPDVITGGSNSVVWLKSDGGAVTPSFTTFTIANGMRLPYVASFDVDGMNLP
jgi:hypothetical protein